VYLNGNRLSTSKYIIDQNDVTLNFTPNTGDILLVNVKQNLTAGAAADRIQQFYQPIDPNNTDPEKNLLTLMGLNFKQHIDDGGSLVNPVYDYGVDGVASGSSTDENINPDEYYFGLADPAMDANRPEELIVTSMSDSLQIYYKFLSP
jgi:hypothetical protein